MKNKISLLIISIFMLFSSIGQAANDTISVNINGYIISVIPAPIIFNGEKVSSDILSFLYDDRTLVHVRFIEEYSDAKVSWDASTKSVNIDHKGKKVKLTIDYGKATVDGKEKILDRGSIPRLAKFAGEPSSKTMVPLSFLSQAMDFEVGWDQKNKTAYINSKTVESADSSEDTSKDIIPDGTNQITEIRMEKIDNRDAIVVSGTKNVKWNTMKFTNPGRLVVDLMDSTIQFGVENEYDYSLGFIKGIRVSQFAPDKNYKPDDKIVRLVFDIKDGTSNFDVNVNSFKNDIVIFPVKETAENTEPDIDNTDIIASQLILETSISKAPIDFLGKDRLIVIDPGHGGDQPGAVSPSGILEKDVNLQISLSLKAALEANGYRVLMTRTDDSRVDNYERAYFANRNMASLFLSIHANASDNRSANGIEVLYAPSIPGTYKHMGQGLLNESLISELSKATGASSRGIIERPKLVVVREPKMPAVLVEVGFLTNAREESLISTTSYQDKIVSGIVNGVNLFFELNQLTIKEANAS